MHGKDNFPYIMNNFVSICKKLLTTRNDNVTIQLFRVFRGTRLQNMNIL